MNKVMPLLALSLLILFGCGNSTETTPAAASEAASTETQTAAPSQPQEDPATKSLRDFLVDIEGTYGWETKSDKISLDFFPDGRLHIQGPDGEATMWQGSWWFDGGKLGMDRVDLGKKVLVTAKQEGESLVLDGVVYTRYKP